MRRHIVALMALCAALALAACVPGCNTLTAAQVQAVDDSTAWASAAATQAAAGQMTATQAAGALQKEASDWKQFQAAVHGTTTTTQPGN